MDKQNSTAWLPTSHPKIIVRNISFAPRDRGTSQFSITSEALIQKALWCWVSSSLAAQTAQVAKDIGSKGTWRGDTDLKSRPIRSAMEYVCLLRQGQVPLRWIHAAWTLWDVTVAGVVLRSKQKKYSMASYEVEKTHPSAGMNLSTNFQLFPENIPTLQLPATLTGLWLSQLGPCIKDQIKLRLEPSWPIGKCQQELTTTVWRARWNIQLLNAIHA